jgi:UDPglucose 6-dehydrogenase
MVSNISIFGLGRVGLVTAACIAKKGYRVVGVDPNDRILRSVRNGKPPFFEPKLAEYLEEVVRSGKLSVTDDPSSTTQSDLAFITVGTPSNRNGSVNLNYVKNAAAMIGRSLRASVVHQTIVVKSTVTPGTARNIVKPIVQKESGKTAARHFSLCSSPEFLREGNAIDDTEFPDRLIIGGEEHEAINRLVDFYREFHGDHKPTVVRTTHESAELMKYANNAFLATKISFINCIANIAELIPFADIKTIAAGIGLDPRIGHQFLNAGLGWGGSCLPKDLKALARFSKALGYNPKLIEAVADRNSQQWRKGLQFAKRALGSLDRKRIAVLGFAFKPNTDDTRDAVSIRIIDGLVREGARVALYDPSAMAKAQAVFQNTIAYAKNPIKCIEGADCCIIVTEWKEFKSIPPTTFVEKMREPVLIDGRRIFDAEEFQKAGTKFFAIGLGPSTEAKNRNHDLCYAPD